MAKDEKGHGSEKHGVTSVFSSRGVGAHGKGMYATLLNGAMLKLNAAATGGRIPGVGEKLDPSQHTIVRGGSDQAAASGLAAGHPKSAPVPVHGGASGPSYNREAVNQAIASSNRAGRRIGGKEARAIHALLRGRQ